MYRLTTCLGAALLLSGFCESSEIPYTLENSMLLHEFLMHNDEIDDDEMIHSIEIPSGSLSKEERNRLYREANFCVYKYHYLMDKANNIIGVYLDEQIYVLWKSTVKAAIECMFVPTKRAKAIVTLIQIVHDLIDHETHRQTLDSFKSAKHCVETAKQWMEKYDEVQNKLLRDE